MPRCPRCLKPVTDERVCVDPHCGYRPKRNYLRPFWTLFAIIGFVHLSLMWRFGVPAVEHPIPVGYWFFVGICWLFINSAATVLIYVPYIFAFELAPEEYGHWLAWAKKAVRPIN
jgi:hypothetical protein